MAYIAGFLDGDGSLMIQVKKRRDGKSKIRFMLTICFYQDSRHDEPLKWFRKILGIGYISKRNDNITELRINGFKQIKEIILKLLPYLKFKKKQAEIMLKTSSLLESKKISDLNKSDLKKIINWILSIQSENYKSHRKKSKEDLVKILGLTP